MEAFIGTFGAIIFLLIISIATNILSKKIKIPYSVLLFLAGIMLMFLSDLSLFSFINSFKLTPELLFYIFLPILVFESGYNIKYTEITKNSRSIWGLAIGGLLISALVIGGLGYFVFNAIGINIPFQVFLLFGAIISATDPVAVLSLFKEVGAPRRLSLIFEGESLFNDGTALALFLIIYEIMSKGTFSSGLVWEGIFMFIVMVIGGIIFGFITGIIFSHIIKLVKNSEQIEITLTIVLSYLTFLLSDIISNHLSIGGFEIKISAIIATAYAAIIMGNYGKTKISPKVEEYMEKFRGYFAYIINSIVFLLLGLLLKTLGVNLINYLVPITTIILVVIIARAISVYIPIGIINKFKLEEKIPKKRQHLLARGSLRGALVIMMVLLIADDFTITGRTQTYSIKQFLMAITIGCVIFSLFIKATTIGPILKKFKLNQLHKLEILEKDQSEAIIYNRIILKLHEFHQKGYIKKNEYDKLHNKYSEKLDYIFKGIKEELLFSNEKAYELVKKSISLHALGIEKWYLKGLFSYNQINENIYRHYLHKINKQISRVEDGISQIKNMNEDNSDYDYNLLDKINTFLSGKLSKNDEYIKNRTKKIISGKVIKELEELKKFFKIYNSYIFDEIINLYEEFNKVAKDHCDEYYSTNGNEISAINEHLTEKSLFKNEESMIKDFFEKEMITPKIYQKLNEDIEKEILKNKNL